MLLTSCTTYLQLVPRSCISILMWAGVLWTIFSMPNALLKSLKAFRPQPLFSRNRSRRITFRSICNQFERDTERKSSTQVALLLLSCSFSLPQLPLKPPVFLDWSYSKNKKLLLRSSIYFRLDSDNVLAGYKERVLMMEAEAGKKVSMDDQQKKEEREEQNYRLKQEQVKQKKEEEGQEEQEIGLEKVQEQEREEERRRLKEEEMERKIGPPPEKPLPGDCCDQGCEVCVWDIYWKELDEYKKLRKGAEESGQ